MSKPKDSAIKKKISLSSRFLKETEVPTQKDLDVYGFQRNIKRQIHMGYKRRNKI